MLSGGDLAGSLNVSHRWNLLSPPVGPAATPSSHARHPRLHSGRRPHRPARLLPDRILPAGHAARWYGCGATPPAAPRGDRVRRDGLPLLRVGGGSDVVRRGLPHAHACHCARPLRHRDAFALRRHAHALRGGRPQRRARAGAAFCRRSSSAATRRRSHVSVCTGTAHHWRAAVRGWLLRHATAAA
uniref:Uncharacterized protein n=1 Tax=Emiliania huxleyi (strain CCMP1516) TaxID=280463 RepID=A0A0D3KJD2_EMIH1